MSLSPQLLAIAAQWTSDQRAKLGTSARTTTTLATDQPTTDQPTSAETPELEIDRTEIARDAVRDAHEIYDWQRFLGKSRMDAAWTAVGGGSAHVMDGISHAVMSATGHKLVDTGSELYWASDGSHRKRKPPKRKRVDTDSPSMGRDNRNFDGTNARARDGGVSQHYKAGTAAGYGHKVNERRRAGKREGMREFRVSLCIVFTARAVEIASYTDDWSGDQARAREHAARKWDWLMDDYKRHVCKIVVDDLGSEPVASHGSPHIGEPISSSRVSPPVREITRDPFDGTYDQWRTAVVGALASIARELVPSKRANDFVPAYRPYSRAKLAKSLRDYQAWAERYGWDEAAGIVSDAITALRDDSLTSAGLAHSFNQADQRLPR